MEQSNIDSRFLKRIEEITFADSKTSNLKRDNANVDGDTAMGMMLQYGATVSKLFSDTYLLRPEVKEAVENGDIYIHDKDFLPMGTTTCTQIELDRLFHNGFSTGHGFLREPQDIKSYAALAAIAIQSNQNDQHGGQSIPAFDYYMAPGITKTFRKEVIKQLETVFDFLNFDEIGQIKDKIIAPIDAKDSNLFKLENRTALEDTLKDQLESLLQTPEAMTICKKVIDRAILETEKAAYQAMESLVHNLNTMHSRAGAQVPFSSINFGTDISEEGRMVSRNLMLAQEAGLGNGETPLFPILIFKVKEGINYNPADPNYDLFKLSLRVSAKRLFPNYVFIDAPFNLKYYKPGDFRTEIATMGCRTRVMGNVNGEEVACGRGNLSFNTINLPRLGIKHGVRYRENAGTDKGFDKQGFFKDLDKMMELCKDALLDRYEIQKRKLVKNFPFLIGQHVWNDSDYSNPYDEIGDILNTGTLSIGFIGLAECLSALIGEHHGQSSKAQRLGLEIIGYMRERMDDYVTKYHLNFSLLATPAEGLSGFFTKIDKQLYGSMPGITDKDYYTNSFHVPVSYPIGIMEKIKIEAPYHELTNAGHISYVEVSGDLAKNLEAFEAIIRCMKESGIGYGSVNHPVDRDPVCGYNGIIEGEYCPHCGRKLSDEYFQDIVAWDTIMQGGNK